MEAEEFLKDLKWSIEETSRKNTYKPSKFYKPSSMKCIRNMYYQRIGADIEKEDTSYILVGICNSGTDIHIRTQQAVECMISNGIDCEYVDVEKYINDNKVPNLEVLEHSGMETKLFSKLYNIVFLCDGIIRYKNNYYILEIKTETSRKFQTRFDTAEEHKNQAQAYSILLGLNKIMFLYVCRDNLDMKTFIYEPTEEEKSLLINKIDYCENCVTNHILPDPPIDRINLKCNYCNYKIRCSNNIN